MEAGEVDGRALDLIDVMIDSADTSVPDYAVGLLEAKGCPTCGSCSGMFTANSMNSLTEALGLSLPGTVLLWQRTKSAQGCLSEPPVRLLPMPKHIILTATSRASAQYSHASGYA